MAVVSISRIQIRRGRKQSGSGLPQLASGELGWAIDTQELYIGNGSVAEGSPYVGNTKLLSEHDNLFEFADTYAYKGTQGIVQTGNTISTPVYRTLQERLDDSVSIRSFGGTGDGTDHTQILQRAIDQLYLNPANKLTPQSRETLVLEPGEYLISDTIMLPPNVTIKGAGADKTFIKVSNPGQFAAFKTVNETSTVGSYASDAVSDTDNQARNIHISDLTVHTTVATAFELISCRDSVFKNINLVGSWELGDVAVKEAPAISLSGLSGVVNCHDNMFENINIKGYSYAVISNQDISNNTWKDCSFKTLYSGIVFGEDTISGVSGQETGPINNCISNSIFDEIERHAVYVYKGKYNISTDNKYYNVGNEGGEEGNNIYPIIQFDDIGGISSNDYFARSEKLGYDSEFFVNVPYTREIEGNLITQMNQSHSIEISESPEATKLFKLPAALRARNYVIEYSYRSNLNAYRTGTMTIVVDPANDTYNLTDEYDFTGDQDLQENLSFDIQLFDENGDNNVDTIGVMVLNYTASDLAQFTYNVRYKS